MQYKRVKRERGRERERERENHSKLCLPWRLFSGEKSAPVRFLHQQPTSFANTHNSLRSPLLRLFPAKPDHCSNASSIYLFPSRFSIPLLLSSLPYLSGADLMARAGHVRLLLSMLALAVAAGPADASAVVGVNWGTMASHPLNPDIVVRMLKDNGITKVKLFDADDWTVSSLAGTGIEAMLGIPNNQLERIAKSYGEAKDWVNANVTRFLHSGGVNIKYVAVGNEPFLESYNGTFINITLPALQNIQKALDEAGHGDKIKATVPLNADVYDSGSNAPSAGNFRANIHTLMVQLVKFLHSNQSPFVVNIYPFLSLYQNKDFPFDFAFFDGQSSPINDKGVSYTNVFDANFDTLVWSLRKAGVPDLKIIVGEVGWPTDGDKNANTANAQRFYRGILKKLSSNKGTPLHPGHIEAYIFGLIDEDVKSVAPGNFERHWGIFRYDGQPKFPIDFSGQGNDRFPIAAKNVTYLPAQWCVLDTSVNNLATLPGNMDYACQYGDCTALADGSSCSNLDSKGRCSYAFNMYFQIQDQDVEACVFGGLAKITTKNMSHDGCLFPVQIVSPANKCYAMSLMGVVTVALTAAVSMVLL
ncbi:glucan endo-1,3-beta-glucosidase 8-like [Nymphaea colorata]|nr:glucan endo-1,3-beta-glucosidase 8-like [Nymphaea colorata]